MDRRCFSLVVCSALLFGCAEQKTPPEPTPKARDDRPAVIEADVTVPRSPAAFENPYAPIPPQCYVKTRRADGSVNNTCAACHRASREPNFVNDAELQLEYALPTPALRNPYTNLLRDDRAATTRTEDADVLAYARRGNYHGPTRIAPSARPGPDGAPPGYAPDAHFRFDERGFDRDPSGNPTGWRAFAYEPLPGGFGPELGSFGDVLIRLPPAFRENPEGVYDETTYVLNLALVEALVRREDVAIEPVDERRYGVDLDGDGVLGPATSVRFRFDRLAEDNLCYVGRAGLDCVASRAPAPGLFPKGTEFLHSLRYLDVTPKGIVPAPRMKELRYARKARALTYAELRNEAAHEAKEREARPDRPRQLLGDGLRGVSNGQGWVYQGFIEDERGELRAQSTEEHLTCVGCHGGVGATTDSSFALPRKLRGKAARYGWLHQLSPERRALPVAPSLPSPARAIELDELYWSIVRAQSFGRGRGPVTVSPDELWRVIPPREPTGVTAPE